ncbi:MAG: glycosyltransferase family 2 protein, partial [Terriglobia bacterium]
VERRTVSKLAQAATLALGGNLAPSHSSGSDTPCITILLCTYNGARFLAAQLASLEQQSHQNWKLLVSDDGSTDATLAIVNHFAQRVAQPVEVRHGPQRGPAANFLFLACDPSIEGDYFAFCDQDDVWNREKLAHALKWMRAAPRNLPAVYGARTRLICAGGAPLGYSRRFSRPPSFANALVQSIAGANTMLFNHATKRLFEQSGPLDVVSHDWWAYQLVSGSGGLVHYDPDPQLDYRQHENNRIGCNRGLRAQLKRLRMVLGGGFTAWNDVNLAALQRCRHHLTDEARALLDTYEAMRKGSVITRLMAFAMSPLRRQTPIGNFALLLAIILRKI